MAHRNPDAQQPLRRGAEQSIRQQARQQARRASARRREERAREEKRLRGQVETVLRALWERDSYVAHQEQVAGAALLAMIRDEGLSLLEAVDWCGGELEVREATRLRRLAEDTERETAGEAAHLAAGPADRSWDNSGGGAKSGAAVGPDGDGVVL